MKIATVPNGVTALRILTAPLFPFAFYAEYNPLHFFWNIDYRIALLAVAAVVACTDWIDGYLARLLNQESELGRQLDPLADGALPIGLLAGILIQSPTLYAMTVYIPAAVVIFYYGCKIDLLRFRGKIGATSRVAKKKMFFLYTGLVFLVAAAAFRQPVFANACEATGVFCGWYAAYLSRVAYFGYVRT